MVRGRRQQVAPPRSRLDARPASVGVDRDRPHPRDPEEDGVLERGDRRRVVACALRVHAHATTVREADDGLDVGRGFGKGDRGRVLVGGQVPRRPRVVPAHLVRDDELAGERGAQVLELCSGRHHDLLPDGFGTESRRRAARHASRSEARAAHP
jgi:hypothetical protein